MAKGFLWWVQLPPKEFYTDVPTLVESEEKNDTDSN